MADSPELLRFVCGDPQRSGRGIYACVCGTTKSIRTAHVRSRRIVSCGCYAKAKAAERAPHMRKGNTTHGASGTRLFCIWLGMKQRCGNPKNQSFKDYGARGITVCTSWLENFANFRDDMGDPPPGMEIDRIDNNRGYEPGNCRWSTRREQQNNRRNNRLLSVGKETMTIAEWSRATGVHRNTIDKRSASLEGDALFEPPNSPRARALRPLKTHCKHGHEFTPENTGMQTTGRFCRQCHAIRQHSRRHG